MLYRSSQTELELERDKLHRLLLSEKACTEEILTQSQVLDELIILNMYRYKNVAQCSTL
ncbi:hypothetical protein DFR58_14721 [Anaerobacterium chartisolvens]|uniref:Spo0E like sporulation regulatory protein n=1 Tax=Anaerobacterium chartisolvens TaxID=1297424 RepID=A0A369AFE4_9FIRM|nr:hypothetical protein [Anaerobacterium chartisolvens]RCX07901.1 hypothetical protein DFR58_14721 [Anaerobacterium chartisolvens]